MTTVARYRLFIVVLLVALTVPRMTQRGMFGDGVLHATIARNMSIGAGTLWAPSYSATTYVEYFEHPPLALALQATAFRVLGDHVFVERLFSLLMFGLTALAMVAIWRRLQPADVDWLPLFLWVLPSIVTWAVINNMLEVTQTVFTTSAVLVLLYGARASTTAGAAMGAAAGGLAIVAAVLSKGPVGFFPLAVPFLFVLLPEHARARRPLLIAGVMLSVVAVSALLLYLYGPSHHALSEYVRVQLAPSLQGQREVNADPLSAFKHLALGIIARMLVIAAVFWLVARRRSTLHLRQSAALFFFATALCASVPIAISPKLVGHYFLASVPFYALGFAALSTGPALALLRSPSRWATWTPLVLAVALAAATIAIPITRGSLEPRDIQFLRNLDAVAPVMPRDRIIGACQSSSADWRLHSYVNRFWRVSLDPRDAPVNGWLLQVDNGCAPPSSCAPAAAGDSLKLFRCD